MSYLFNLSFTMSISSPSSSSIQTLQAVTQLIFHYPLLEEVDVGLSVAIGDCDKGRPTTIENLLTN
jgi:hypothetical protein